jgi:protein Tex
MSEDLVQASLARLPAVLAEELKLNPAAVSAVLGLFEEGATIPFIARYRKERTGGLDEVQIRDIQQRHTYLVELEQRRGTILASIAEQGKLDDALKKKILGTQSKTELEDLYLPYRPKRRTRATMARERGLEPLAMRILHQPLSADAKAEAAAFVNSEKDVPDLESAWAGARDIVAETLADDAGSRAWVRGVYQREGILTSTVRSKKVAEQRTKFEQYYDYGEAISKVPSHRYLAMDRGESEKVLRLGIDVDEDRIIAELERRFNLNRKSSFAKEFELAIADSFRRLIAPSIENEMRQQLKASSDQKAIEVFANNLRNLLLASPLGAKAVLGIDPGLRTGCKVVALDTTGRFKENTTLYLGQGEGKQAKAKSELKTLLQKHQPYAVAVGNGTGGREAESFVRELIRAEELGKTVVVQVNEAGASVYSASDIAREEFPQLDLTVRGAISIARRLQDPLAELVKIEPKAIGVGQYQHDVSQGELQTSLADVVESCVNQVGVELNTASGPLLAQVAGIGPRLAKKIVDHREAKGPFANRRGLLAVGGLGAKTFEQAAGFIRIRQSENPLDRSAVHPERYSLVEKMAKDLGTPLNTLVGDASLADKIDISRYVAGDVGEPTLRDILDELRKPGRDPRQTFEAPQFRDDVSEMEDLKEGMQLQGIVTNVTAFGAFVDVGVHQDGLVHISQLADRFVEDPHQVVKVGDRLKVRVMEVDLQRRRISLTARQEASAEPAAHRPQQQMPNAKGKGRPSDSRSQRGGPKSRSQPKPAQKDAFSNNPFADLLNKKRRSDS